MTRAKGKGGREYGARTDWGDTLETIMPLPSTVDPALLPPWVESGSVLRLELSGSAHRMASGVFSSRRPRPGGKANAVADGSSEDRGAWVNVTRSAHRHEQGEEEQKKGKDPEMGKERGDETTVGGKAKRDERKEKSQTHVSGAHKASATVKLQHLLLPKLPCAATERYEHRTLSRDGLGLSNDKKWIHEGMRGASQAEGDTQRDTDTHFGWTQKKTDSLETITRMGQFPWQIALPEARDEKKRVIGGTSLCHTERMGEAWTPNSGISGAKLVSLRFARPDSEQHYSSFDPTHPVSEPKSPTSVPNTARITRSKQNILSSLVCTVDAPGYLYTSLGGQAGSPALPLSTLTAQRVLYLGIRYYGLVSSVTLGIQHYHHGIGVQLGNETALRCAHPSRVRRLSSRLRCWMW
ncbi:hypothetical protein C8R45DRAFT_1181151 [Mycena sanguinolenta]|nr:hypothetical protein C8R45DRAFT_1181151 [Mycena sanguinolenta]